MTPVVLAGAMALVFQQALALVMGLIGPAMVLGSWYQSHRHATRTHDKAMSDFLEAQSQHLREVSELRAREQAQALSLLPSLNEVAAQPLWRRSTLREQGCRIGLGWAEFPQGHPLFASPGMSGMPSVLDVSQNVALVGDDSCAGVWRTLAVSWALAHSLVLRLDSQGELPRSVMGSSEAHWVSSLEQVPEACRVVVISQDLPTVEVRSSGVTGFRILPDRLSIAQAVWLLRRFDALDESSPDADSLDLSARNQVWCSLSDSSPAWDLVKEGPHAVIWGATGSGKSVTVRSLVHSLAARYSPESMVCVLIDFKGGAGLRELQSLPHTIGSVTDMEGSSASRALNGLHAELLRRERILERWGVTDISEIDDTVALPRLLVVIDEVAWLFTNFPDFQPALADVLARGRSLGVHVVLATQMVTGVLTQAMMANISLRICGRVSDEHEVVSWIPDAQGALRDRMRHLPPGEVVLVGASTPPAVHAVSHHREAVIEGEKSLWRVWADPLPAQMQLTADAWGVADDLPSQSHRSLGSHDAPTGSCWVVGDPGRGKTTALATLSALSPGAMRAPRHPLLLWLWWASNPEPSAIVLDDLDRTLARAGVEGAHFLLDLLQSATNPLLISSGPEGVHQRILGRMCEDIVVLGIAKKESREVLGGGGCPLPGRAHYRDQTVQIAMGAPAMTEPKIPRIIPAVGACVVTRAPDGWAGAPIALVMSPEELARRWHEVSDCEDIILDRIPPREVRGATLGRIHPPPLPVPDDVVLVWHQDGFELATRAWWRE